MCKEQRKLLLMVTLGGVIPVELFKKFNDCRFCRNYECECAHLEAKFKDCRVITILGDLDTETYRYCPNWEGEK